MSSLKSLSLIHIVCVGTLFAKKKSGRISEHAVNNYEQDSMYKRFMHVEATVKRSKLYTCRDKKKQHTSVSRIVYNHYLSLFQLLFIYQNQGFLIRTVIKMTFCRPRAETMPARRQSLHFTV